METIYVKKQPKPNAPDAFQFVVPAVGIQTPEGTRLIPHPYGNEATMFDTLEETMTQVHRAGYAMECDGRHYPIPGRSVSAIRPKSAVTSDNPVLRHVQAAIPALLTQLQDTNPNVISSAAVALGEMREESAIQGLVHAFGHEDANVRRHAAEALAKIGQPMRRSLQLALQDKHWLVRHSALAAISVLIHQRSDLLTELLGEVLPLLKDDNWLVRSQAATVLGEAAKAYQPKE